MKKRVIWLLVSCLMVAALLLASCGPAVEEEEEVAPPPVEEEEGVAPPEEEEEVAPSPDEPKYGGVFRQAVSAGPLRFDDGLIHLFSAYPILLTNEGLLTGDWTKGPAGTGEVTWINGNMGPDLSLAVGRLAESWEFPEPGTMVFHIRKGVHFHNKPPANGREMTADDVAFSLQRSLTTRGSLFSGSAEALFGEAEVAKAITTPDKWTVVVELVPEEARLGFVIFSDHIMIWPRDAVEEYGDMDEWENNCGTGPFMLIDYVAGSSITFERNPNYWLRDPIGPGKGNRLPYLDGVKFLIIPDLSTRLAALRTGKIDLLGSLAWEDAEAFMKTNPELKYVEYQSCDPIFLWWRVDTKPFDDIRVRRALNMAVDNELIANEYYGGRADVLNWPVPNVPLWSSIYIPLDELPESTRELYEYHPDKARQLLAEAGYPNGFKTEVVCYTPMVDLLSIVKDYWEDIGVDLELKVKELGAWMSIRTAKSYQQIIATSVMSTTDVYALKGPTGDYFNYCRTDDPVPLETMQAVSATAPPDETKRRQLIKEVTPYLLEQAYMLPMPSPYIYTFWQPWVKNYHGENVVGYACSVFRQFTFTWYDQELKEEMTGTR